MSNDLRIFARHRCRFSRQVEIPRADGATHLEELYNLILSDPIILLDEIPSINHNPPDQTPFSTFLIYNLKEKKQTKNI
jgi:hypothetical protein